jgi:hypothetical protein
MTSRLDRPVLQLSDLTPLQRTYLGVLDTGMVAAQLAGDPTLRVDHVTAVCQALREGRPRDSYLAADVTPAAAFVADLTSAALDLDAKGVISLGPPPADLLLTADAPPQHTPSEVDFEQRPRVLDRYLAHTCLEELFADARVYPFLMGKYQDSGEVWARLYKERPERFL